MGLIDKAVTEGVERGMYEAFAAKIKKCGDCYDDPEDRCVMSPKDGCACMHMRWSRLPWYRRIFTKEPAKPSLESVSRAAIGLLIEEVALEHRTASRKPRTAPEATP